MFFLSEICSVDLATIAFNFALFFDIIFVQCWDGSLKIINILDSQHIRSVSIPDFTLPGRIKVVGSSVIISQGNRLLSFRIEKLQSATDDQLYVAVS